MARRLPGFRKMVECRDWVSALESSSTTPRRGEPMRDNAAEVLGPIGRGPPVTAILARRRTLDDLEPRSVGLLGIISDAMEAERDRDATDPNMGEEDASVVEKLWVPSTVTPPDNDRGAVESCRKCFVSDGVGAE